MLFQATLIGEELGAVGHETVVLGARLLYSRSQLRNQWSTYLVLVDEEVLLQVGAGAKLLVADPADVRLFSRVDSLVAYQIAYL